LPNEAFAPLDLIVVYRRRPGASKIMEFTKRDRGTRNISLRRSTIVISQSATKAISPFSDLRCDMRAPPPRAAADELIVPDSERSQRQDRRFAHGASRQLLNRVREPKVWIRERDLQRCPSTRSTV